MPAIIDQKLEQLKLQLESAAVSLYQLTVKVDHEEMRTLMEDIKVHLNDPFMFVIVGEVKVGKSSFINALLESEEDICAVAPHPMTDVIHQIVHGAEKMETVINPFLKKITNPASILEHISIVDTPGTNTIVEHHQEITERFIPSSDLIIFVFEAKNPYRQSAWDFFEFVKEDWHKKVIFVLQQKDLLPEEDLKINMQGVKDHAAKKGIKDAVVFGVSAKLEQDKDHEASGFKALRKYINDNITGGQAPVLKLLSHANTCDQVNERLRQGLEDRKRQLESDKRFREDIQDSLNDHERISKNQVRILSENLLAAYDKITSDTRNELNSGLGFFSVLRKSFLSLFDREQAAKPWLERIATELEQKLNTSLKSRLDLGVRDISDSLQQMAQIIGLKIQQSHTILKDDHDVFSRIADRRSRILADLQDTFASFLNDSENFYPQDMLQGSNRLAPNVATGTGVAVLGAILTALTNGMVFDITGGVLTAVGLIFAGASLGFSKRKLLKRYKEEISSGRKKLELDIHEKLETYISWIKSKIEDNFDNFDAHLINEESEIESLTAEHDRINDELETLQNKIRSDYDISL